jgi:hypothetical protein
VLNRQMPTIGVTSRHRNVHAEVKNPVVSAQYRDVRLYPQGTRLKRLHPTFGFVTAVGIPREASVDAYHSRQTILLTQKPWFVGHDTQMPFYPRPHMHRRIPSWLFDQLAKPQCRGVLPYTDYARNILRTRNHDHPLLNDVLAKTRVVTPAVDTDEAQAEQNIADTLERPVRLLFVGSQFYLKGGHWLVQALRELNLPRFRRAGGIGWLCCLGRYGVACFEGDRGQVSEG